MNTSALAKKVIAELREFSPFLYSGHGVSKYIHFKNLPKGYTHKLRISDHDEQKRYGYKWQLRTDGVPPPNKRKPFVIYADDADVLIRTFRAYYARVAADSNN